MDSFGSCQSSSPSFRKSASGIIGFSEFDLSDGSDEEEDHPSPRVEVKGAERRERRRNRHASNGESHSSSSWSNSALFPFPSSRSGSESSGKSKRKHEDDEEANAAPAITFVSEQGMSEVMVAEQDYQQHNLGLCSPCRFALLPGGCNRGDACDFCHHPAHGLEDVNVTPSQTKRPAKAVRLGYKRLVEEVRNSNMSEEEKDKTLEDLANKSAYIRCLLKPDPKAVLSPGLQTKRNFGATSSSSSYPADVSGGAKGMSQVLEPGTSDVPRLPGIQSTVFPPLRQSAGPVQSNKISL